MNQLDFVGGLPSVAPAPFKDIRNTRSMVAEEKARLCLELGALCKTPPSRVRNGSVNLTREWLNCQKKSIALAARARASVIELGMAVKNMRRFLEDA